MELNPQNWEAVFDRYQAAVDNSLRGIISDSVVELGRRLIERTPVKSGLAKGSWKVGFDTPDTSLGSADPSGGTALSEIRTKVYEYKVSTNSVIYLSNAVYYLYYIEFGSSRNRPQPFTRQTFAEMPSIINEYIAKYRFVM